MQGLQQIDADLFRFLNLKLANPVLDAVMPFLSGNAFFRPAIVVIGAFMIWKWRLRGFLFVLMLGLAVGMADGVVSRTLKEAIGRPRPFWTIPEARCLVGKSGSGSMPSSHAANWFAATLVALVYYRRSVFFMLPLALAVSFSRIYNGVHYPSDVVAGALVGAGSAATVMVLVQALWAWIGRRWFPLWWEKLPNLLAPPGRKVSADEDAPEEADAPLPKIRGRAPAGFQAPHASLDAHWLRLGVVWIVVVLLARLAYIASGTIQLAGDEAYQWLWSKHLDLSYFSKPPLIAYTQFLGTALWGDTAFGIRFFSPIISALIGLLMLRFFAREVNARAGFFLLLIVTATPLLAVGAVLMTIDPLSVLFWTAAMLSGWRAVQENSKTRDWLWTGLWLGLGFLSKYTELLQLLCWVVFFILWRPARKQLRRPGPYLGLLVNFLCATPVLVWNAQHQWITVAHVEDNAGINQAWHPTLRYTVDFLGSEAGLLITPVFFGATLWAAIAFWRNSRNNPRLVYFFSMGAPLFLAYFLHSFRSRILPNWIAPSVLPLFCVMVIYWDTRLRLGVKAVKPWLAAGLVFGFTVVLVGHQTNLVEKLTGHSLPIKLDPLHRVRKWDETARLVGQVRNELLAEGKPVFIIADHYGMAGEISFYLPEARARVKTDPLVYFRTSLKPENQFYFWPGYTNRHGENAVFVFELDRYNPERTMVPSNVWDQFESVQDLGVRPVLYHGQVLRPLQFLACRNLK